MLEDLTPLQKQLVAQPDGRRKSGRAVAALITAYAEAVAKTAPPNQARMFGKRPSREQLLKSAVKQVGSVWVDARRWSIPQRAVSGHNIPATHVQQLSQLSLAAGNSLQ